MQQEHMEQQPPAGTAMTLAAGTLQAAAVALWSSPNQPPAAGPVLHPCSGRAACMCGQQSTCSTNNPKLVCAACSRAHLHAPRLSATCFCRCILGAAGPGAVGGLLCCVPVPLLAAGSKSQPAWAGAQHWTGGQGPVVPAAAWAGGAAESAGCRFPLATVGCVADFC